MALKRTEFNVIRRKYIYIYFKMKYLVARELIEKIL